VCWNTLIPTYTVSKKNFCKSFRPTSTKTTITTTTTTRTTITITATITYHSICNQYYSISFNKNSTLFQNTIQYKHFILCNMYSKSTEYTFIVYSVCFNMYRISIQYLYVTYSLVFNKYSINIQYVLKCFSISIQ